MTPSDKAFRMTPLRGSESGRPAKLQVAWGLVSTSTLGIHPGCRWRHSGAALPYTTCLFGEPGFGHESAHSVLQTNVSRLNQYIHVEGGTRWPKLPPSRRLLSKESSAAQYVPGCYERRLDRVVRRSRGGPSGRMDQSAQDHNSRIPFDGRDLARRSSRRLSG